MKFISKALSLKLSKIERWSRYPPNEAAFAVNFGGTTSYTSSKSWTKFFYYQFIIKKGMIVLSDNRTLKEKIRDGLEDLGSKVATSIADEALKPQLKTVSSKCDAIKTVIDENQLSDSARHQLVAVLKDVVHTFGMSVYAVAVSKEMKKDMEKIRVEYFGKNSKLSQMMHSIGTYDKDDRKEVGRVVNTVKSGLEKTFNEFADEVNILLAKQNIANETIDVTLPGKKQDIGTIHPINKVFYELCDIFIGMGFTIKEGPEIEMDEYSFDKLNIPKDHPARDMQDTFYITEDVVLRPHTSPVQIRTMISEKPPIRILSPGRVYRSDDIDATHSPVFNQMEGLVIDKGISMAHLKGLLDTFASQFFGDDIKVRLRPSYFPFTEPSAEVDLTCVNCKGKGCSVCKQTGWIEVLGCGMVHPNVLRNCGIDPEEYSGFAFGMGLDRIANLKYESNDIRLLYENDARFLRQF